MRILFDKNVPVGVRGFLPHPRGPYFRRIAMARPTEKRRTFDHGGTSRVRRHGYFRSEHPLSAKPVRPKTRFGRPRIQYLADCTPVRRSDWGQSRWSIAGRVLLHRNAASAKASKRVAHWHVYFAFLCGFSLRVRDGKHRNAAGIGEDPRRNPSDGGPVRRRADGHLATATCGLPYFAPLGLENRVRGNSFGHVSKGLPIGWDGVQTDRPAENSNCDATPPRSLRRDPYWQTLLILVRSPSGSITR